MRSWRLDFTPAPWQSCSLSVPIAAIGVEKLDNKVCQFSREVTSQILWICLLYDERTSAAVTTSAAECLAVVYLSWGMSCSRLPQLRNVLQSSQETEHVAYHLLYALSRSFIAAINLSTITRKSFTLKRKPLPWSVLRDQSRFQDWFHRHTPDFACGYGVLQLCNCCVQPVQCLFSHTRRIVLSFRPERFQKSTDFKRSTAVFSATPGSWKDKLTLLTSQFSFRTRHRAVDPLISTWSCLRNQRNWLQQNSSQLRICRPGLQATAHKNFHFHQLRAPKTAGPGAAAPLAPSPPLMRHW